VFVDNTVATPFNPSPFAAGVEHCRTSAADDTQAKAQGSLSNRPHDARSVQRDPAPAQVARRNAPTASPPEYASPACAMQEIED